MSYDYRRGDLQRDLSILPAEQTMETLTAWNTAEIEIY